MRDQFLEEIDRAIEESDRKSRQGHFSLAGRAAGGIEGFVQNLISFTYHLIKNAIVLALIILFLFCIHVAIKINGGYDNIRRAYTDFSKWSREAK